MTVKLCEPAIAVSAEDNASILIDKTSNQHVDGGMRSATGSSPAEKRYLRGSYGTHNHHHHHSKKPKHYHKHPHKHPNYSILGKHVHQHGSVKHPSYHQAKKHHHKHKSKPPKWHAYNSASVKKRTKQYHGATYGGNTALLANQLILSALPYNRYQDRLYDRINVYASEQNRVEQPRFQANLQQRMSRHWGTFQGLIQRASDPVLNYRLQAALYRNYPLYERFAERVNSEGFVEPLQLQLYTSLFSPTGESSYQHTTEAQAVDAAYGSHVP